MFKEILIVNKFLCFSLETGVLAISWFLLCVFIIVELIINYSLVQTLIRCENWKNTATHNDTDLIKDLTDTSDTNCFETSSTVLVALLALLLLALVVFCLLCIKGTKERNHRLIKPLMIWEGILTVTSVISIVSNPLNGIVMSILNAYMFVTLYSLYLKLKAEHEGDGEVVEMPELDLKEKV
ncbi:uncharacterized protein LOC119079541 [Bradysia coprophila]|uniref:uncharacterized protein LOC119079541 n=1 Tax=Bradysia coprophila TaxID=38358 RepID=UPI00187D9D2C|nr:uncharacterized protein LOC119079541 [Bradysia coprophila]